MTDQCQPHHLEDIRMALIEILETHPNRRAFQNGKKTWKVYGWEATPVGDITQRKIITRTINNCENVSTKVLKQNLKQLNLPWERKSL